jgi:serine/threonine protein kinase/tetratricopeptide (TPR) repeat protein
MTGRSVGPYQILDKLGEGGMGAVYKARDTRLGREVALKFLPADVTGDEERRVRFLREAQSASRLNHPNIVTIYDIGEGDGSHFITMEYVSGKTLAYAIPAHGLEGSLAIRLAIQICSALGKAHSAGIIHRDLKPANIMLTDEGVAKVLDFGLAKLSEPASCSDTAVTLTAFSDRADTRLGIVVGTAAYMSPEQASGLAVDHRSDIFSFGLVLYEMLSGERAFPGHTPMVAMAAILHSEPRPLNIVPVSRAAIVMRCLRKNPDERFQTMAAVRHALEESESLSGGTAALTAAIQKSPSLAVLPFVNMNRDEENEFFCDGLTEELINALSQLRNLRIVSRSTVFQFKGAITDIRLIGEKLQVTTALEGSVRKSGNRLRITAQLVNLSDGCQIWSQRFDREMKDIFEVQDEVTLAIVEHLKIRLTGEQQPAAARRAPENPEAYTLYLKGRYHQHRLTAEGYQKALACFDEAISLDPGNARAYAGIAEIYTFMAIVGIAPPNDIMPKAKAAALRALEIDESLAEANSALGTVHLWYDWDWLSAQRRLRRAVELSPGNPDVHTNLAMLLTRLGRRQEAMKEAQHAVTIDPLALQAQFGLADAQFLGRFPMEKLIGQCRNVIQLVPQALWPHWYLIDAYGQNRDFDEIPAAVATARPVAAGEPISEGIFGWALALAGHIGEARQILEALRERRRHYYCPATPISWIYLGLGDYQQALDWLDTAYNERDPLLAMVFVNPTHDVLRSDPRFEALLRRMNFSGELPTL